MESNWKPLSKSEYIIWKVETMEQIKNKFPDYNEDTINDYFEKAKAVVKRKIERSGKRFTDFE